MVCLCVCLLQSCILHVSGEALLLSILLHPLHLLAVPTSGGVGELTLSRLLLVAGLLWVFVPSVAQQLALGTLPRPCEELFFLVWAVPTLLGGLLPACELQHHWDGLSVLGFWPLQASCLCDVFPQPGCLQSRWVRSCLSVLLHV